MLAHDAELAPGGRPGRRVQIFVARSLLEVGERVREAVEAVAKDTAGEIVAAMGASADADAVTAAVTNRMKG